MIDYQTKFNHIFKNLLIIIFIFPPFGFIYFTYGTQTKLDKVTSTLQKTLNDPSSVKSVLKLRGSIQDIVLSKDGQTAFLVAQSRGIYIIDLENPLKPKLISQFKYYKNSYDKSRSLHLSHDERSLFVRDAQAGIYRIDISNLDEPKLLSTFAPNLSITDFRISNNSHYLYVTHSKGLDIADISNADEIVSITTFNEGYKYFDVEQVNEELLYLLSPVGIDIIDINSIDKPKLTRKYTTLNNPRKIRLSPKKDISYISSEQGEIEILDIKNSMHPIASGEYSSRGSVYNIHASKDTIFIANKNNDLEVVDIRFSDDAKLLKRIPKGEKTRTQIYNSFLSPNEKVLYLAHGNLGISLISLK